MIDDEKMETLKQSFKENAFVISDVPFELPIVHIHQDITPTLDHSKDGLEYTIRFVVERHQEQVNDEIMKNIRQIMKEKGISEYYSIDEKRLLEIVEEAKAFEIIKNKSVNLYHFEYVQRFPIDEQLERYNDILYVRERDFLTQQEYDLVKKAILK